jgi:DNA-binding CsgD family transcriptional regulator
MSDIEQFSGLVGDIYDAALDPALWPGVFMRACKFIGASAATLASHDIAALNLPSPPEAIVDEFKLTPRELRVLFAIVEVGGVPEVAEVLGVSAATVRTHLARLFDKTGTSRQADLVKLVAAFSNPLLR